jgi:hypothetical protein
MKDEVNDFIAEPEHKGKDMSEVLAWWNTRKYSDEFKFLVEKQSCASCNINSYQFTTCYFASVEVAEQALAVMKDEVNDFIAEPEHKGKDMSEVLAWWNTRKNSDEFKFLVEKRSFDDQLCKSYAALKELLDTSTLFDVPIVHDLFDIINKCQRYHNLRVNGLQSPMTHAHVRMLSAIAFDLWRVYVCIKTTKKYTSISRPHERINCRQKQRSSDFSSTFFRSCPPRSTRMLCTIHSARYSLKFQSHDDH